MHCLTRVVLALPLVASTLAAQSPVIPAWPVASESRVRVLSPVLSDKKQVGVAVAATRDTLSFRGEKQPSDVSIGTPDIRQLEISQGTHTNRLTGGLIGLVVGAAAGAAIGAATYKESPTTIADSRWFNAIGGGLAGGVLGTIAGALIGGRKVETWVPVAVPAR
jgi:hypothetical protein